MFNATRACEVLVGLPAVRVLGVRELLSLDGRVVVTVESVVEVPLCPACGERAWVKDRPVVELVDLTSFGRPVTLRWRKHRWCCGGGRVGRDRGRMRTRRSRRLGCRSPLGRAGGRRSRLVAMVGPCPTLPVSSALTGMRSTTR